METLTTSQLEQNLLNHNSGAIIVSFMTKTDAKARKTGNPFGIILKQSFFVGQIGCDYQADVNRQREREGKPADFQSQEHKWAVPVSDSPYLMENPKTGERYAKIRPLRSVATKRFYAKSDGRRLPNAPVEPLLPPPRKSNTQGTVKEIPYKLFKLTSIQRIKWGKETYKIIASNPPVVQAVHRPAPAEEQVAEAIA